MINSSKTNKGKREKTQTTSIWNKRGRYSLAPCTHQKNTKQILQTTLLTLIQQLRLRGAIHQAKQTKQDIRITTMYTKRNSLNSSIVIKKTEFII